MRAYPFYMTTTVADKSFFDAKVKLFQYFGWEKVAIIYEVQSMELFSVGFNTYRYISIHRKSEQKSLLFYRLFSL